MASVSFNCVVVSLCSVKPVESVYVDTTFCIPKMASLPSRVSVITVISISHRLLNVKW